jgi:hypothetical protein
MRFIRSLFLGLLTLALLAIPFAGSADAATRPAFGRLADASGAFDGCQADTSWGIGNLGNGNLAAYTTLDCPASANVHFVQGFASIYLVSPDRTWTQVAAYKQTHWINSANVITNAGAFSREAPCLSGTHTYIERSTMIARESTTAEKYVINLQYEAMVTC